MKKSVIVKTLCTAMAALLITFFTQGCGPGGGAEEEGTKTDVPVPTKKGKERKK